MLPYIEYGRRKINAETIRIVEVNKVDKKRRKKTVFVQKAIRQHNNLLIFCDQMSTHVQLKYTNSQCHESEVNCNKIETRGKRIFGYVID